MGALRVAFSMIFWNFGKKWQPAFGLRLRGQIGVRASCFYSLSLNWRPLFFQRFFYVFWGHPGIPKSAKKPSESQVSLKWASSEPQVNLERSPNSPKLMKWKHAQTLFVKKRICGECLFLCRLLLCSWWLAGWPKPWSAHTGAAQTLFLSFSRAVSVRRICDILCILYILCTSMYAYACTSMHMHAYSLRALWRHCLKFVDLLGVFFQSWTFS